VHDQPDAAEILRTVGDFLRDELLPTLDGALAYRTRVAINLVTILERQERLGPGHLATERALLSELIPPSSADEADLTDLTALNAALCRELDDHPLADREFDRQAWTALMTVARDKLEIARPGYGGDG
jgi:Domain of unknown function (DUF6285)